MQIAVYRHGITNATNGGIACVYGFIALGGISTYSDKPIYWLLTVPIWLFAALFAISAFRQRIEIYTDHLEIFVGAFGKRDLAWKEVESIDSGMVPESRWFRHAHFSSYAKLRDGEVVRLPIPGRDAAGHTWISRILENRHADISGAEVPG